MLRALGAFLAHLIVTTLTLVAVGVGLYLFAPKVVEWGLNAHSQAALDHASVAAGVQARGSETSSINQSQAACLHEASSGVRAGRVLQRLSGSSAQKPVEVTADDLRSVVGP